VVKGEKTFKAEEVDQEGRSNLDDSLVQIEKPSIFDYSNAEAGASKRGESKVEFCCFRRDSEVVEKEESSVKFHTHKSFLEEDYNPRAGCPEKPSSQCRKIEYVETFGKQHNRKNHLSIDTGEVRNLIAGDVLNSSSCTSPV